MTEDDSYLRAPSSHPEIAGKECRRDEFLANKLANLFDEDNLRCYKQVKPADGKPIYMSYSMYYLQQLYTPPLDESRSGMK
jgi:hypothetical protein